MRSTYAQMLKARSILCCGRFNSSCPEKRISHKLRLKGLSIVFFLPALHISLGVLESTAASRMSHIEVMRSGYP